MIIFFIGAAGGVAFAQSRADQMRASTGNAAQILGMLTLDDRIRLVAQDRAVMAHAPQVIGDSLRVIIEGRGWTLPLADIDSVWVKDGAHERLGAAITGVPMAILGFIAGFAFACGDNPSPCAGREAAGLRVGIVVGAVGALPGLLVGSLIHRWPLVYTRKTSPT